MATDIGEASEAGMNKYAGDHSSSIDSVNQFNNYIPETENNHQANFNNASDYPEYETTGSFKPEVTQLEIGVLVQHLPDSDVTQQLFFVK